MNIDFGANLLERIASTGQLGQAEKHLITPSAAKYVRPRFLFSCGEILGVTEDKLVNFASAVELMHTATLIHDDIIDEAMERRSLPSVNAQFGNKFAVLAGDGMLAQALAILASGPQSEHTTLRAAETLTAMVDAVALELELRDKQPTEEQLISIVDGKTGALFSLCGYLAGIAANDDRAAHDLSDVGVLVGRIFQIKDDIDDIEEDKKNRIPTFPTFMSVESSENQISGSLEKIKETLSKLETSTNKKSIEDLVDTIQTIIRVE